METGGGPHEGTNSEFSAIVFAQTLVVLDCLKPFYILDHFYVLELMRLWSILCMLSQKIFSMLVLFKKKKCANKKV